MYTNKNSCTDTRNNKYKYNIYMAAWESANTRRGEGRMKHLKRGISADIDSARRQKVCFK